MNFWPAVKRPLFVAFLLGCTVSLMTARALTLRILVPAMVYWSAVPLIEIAALAVVGTHRGADNLVNDDGQALVRVLRWTAGCLLVLAVSIGTISDTARPRPRLVLGGYEVLAADFHLHTFPLSWGVLAPWDTVLEARRNGLDVIAITPHNHTWVAKVAQWFSRWSGDPIVLVVRTVRYFDKLR